MTGSDNQSRTRSDPATPPELRVYSARPPTNEEADLNILHTNPEQAAIEESEITYDFREVLRQAHIGGFWKFMSVFRAGPGYVGAGGREKIRPVRRSNVPDSDP